MWVLKNYCFYFPRVSGRERLQLLDKRPLCFITSVPGVEHVLLIRWWRFCAVPRRYSHLIATVPWSQPSSYSTFTVKPGTVVIRVGDRGQGRVELVLSRMHHVSSWSHCLRIAWRLLSCSYVTSRSHLSWAVGYHSDFACSYAVDYRYRCGQTRHWQTPTNTPVLAILTAKYTNSNCCGNAWKICVLWLKTKICIMEQAFTPTYFFAAYLIENDAVTILPCKGKQLQLLI